MVGFASQVKQCTLGSMMRHSLSYTFHFAEAVFSDQQKRLALVLLTEIKTFYLSFVGALMNDMISNRGGGGGRVCLLLLLSTHISGLLQGFQSTSFTKIRRDSALHSTSSAVSDEKTRKFLDWSDAEGRET